MSRFSSSAMGVGRRAIGLVCLFGLAGCSDAPGGNRAAADQPTAEQAAAPTPKLVVAVVDFSGSLTSHATRDARAYLEDVVEELDFGDRFVMLEMYRRGARDSVGRFVQDMPVPNRAGAVTSYDRRQLESAKRGIAEALPVFFDPRFVGTVATTDVFTTLHIASEYLRDAGRREPQLIVLSDMLQSTPAFEFEGARRMPEDGWVAQQKEGHLVPSLADACVVVIGADPTTAEGQRVRAFWADYFDAAGARLDPANYRSRPPVDVVSC